MAATEAAIVDMVAERFNDGEELPTETSPDTLVLVREEKQWKLRLYWDVAILTDEANELASEGKHQEALEKYAAAAEIGRFSPAQKVAREAIQYTLDHVTIENFRVEKARYTSSDWYYVDVTNSGDRDITLLFANISYEDGSGRIVGTEAFIITDIEAHQTKTENSILTSVPSNWDGRTFTISKGRAFFADDRE